LHPNSQISQRREDPGKSMKSMDRRRWVMI
jgi:hypothetical protein